MRRVSPAKPEPGRIGPSNVARAFDEHARSYDRLVGANPATTSTCGCPPAAWACATGAPGCGCSTSAAAPARPPRRCWTPRRRPRSSASTRRRDAARSPGPRPGRRGVSFVHASADDLAQRRDHRPLRRHPRRLPAAQPRRAQRRAARVPRAAQARRAAGGARVLGGRLGAQQGDLDRRLLERDHPDGQAPDRAPRISTGTCGAACWTSTASRRSPPGCTPPGSSTCGCRRSPAGSSTSCTRSSAGAPPSRTRRRWA